MARNFRLLLSLRTSRGFEVCGEFVLGNDCDSANALFGSLHGDALVCDLACIHIDLVETANGIPESIKTKYCSLEEWCINSKLIIKELFRLKSLEDSL